MIDFLDPDQVERAARDAKSAALRLETVPGQGERLATLNEIVILLEELAVLTPPVNAELPAEPKCKCGRLLTGPIERATGVCGFCDVTGRSA